MICRRVEGTSTILRTPLSHTALECLRFSPDLHTQCGCCPLTDDYTVPQASLNDSGSFSDILRPHSMRYYGPSPPSERSQCVIIDVYSEEERPDCISITSLLVPRLLGSDVEPFVCVSRSSVCYLELNYLPCPSAAEHQAVSRRDSWPTSLRSH